MSESLLRDVVTQTTLPQTDRNHATAVHYANLIQHRKDVEAVNLAALERLLDLPSSVTNSASDPSAEDVGEAVGLLNLFQASDFDALVEERNINRRCGYFLCGKQNELQDTSAKFRILHGAKSREHGLRIVQTRDLEKWCSNDCARRAQQVRVQLSSEPAWTRDPGGPAGIVIPHGSPTASTDNLLERQLQTSEEPQDKQSIVDTSRMLALERGEHNPRSSSTTDIEIEERLPMEIEDLTDRFRELGAHDTVEGYRPGLSARQKKTNASEDNSDDILSTL